MSKVTLWKAADGSLHETHKAFLAYEAKAKIVKTMDIATAKIDWTVVERFDEVQGEFIDVQNVGKFVADNAEILKFILDDALINKRTKAVK